MSKAIKFILRSIKKGKRTEQIDEGVKIAGEPGYFVMLFFIIGFPGDMGTDSEFSEFLTKISCRSGGIFQYGPVSGDRII